MKLLSRISNYPKIYLEFTELIQNVANRFANGSAHSRINLADIISRPVTFGLFDIFKAKNLYLLFSWAELKPFMNINGPRKWFFQRAGERTINSNDLRVTNSAQMISRYAQTKQLVRFMFATESK